MKINGEMHYLWRAVDQEGVDRRRVAIRLTAPPGGPWLPISYREAPRMAQFRGFRGRRTGVGESALGVFRLAEADFSVASFATTACRGQL